MAHVVHLRVRGDFPKTLERPSDPVTRLVGGPEMFVESSSMINLTCLVAWTAKPPDKVSSPPGELHFTFSGGLAPQWIRGHLQRTQDRRLSHHWQVGGRKIMTDRTLTVHHRSHLKKGSYWILMSFLGDNCEPFATESHTARFGKLHLQVQT